MASSTEPTGEAAELRRGFGLLATGFGGRRIVGMVSERVAGEGGTGHGSGKGDGKPVQPE